MNGLSGQLSQSMADMNRNVGDRLDNAAKMFGDVKQQLGMLDQSSRAILEVGKNISGLENILKPPKIRGGLGETLLENLLSQILPSSCYETQYHFSGGETVDAIVRLNSGMVPIDAKFPLENFRRIMDAETDDDRKTARKVFLKDVKGHIDTIAGKYVRPAEGTFDFALMYIPAENVYYETIIKDEETDGNTALAEYAFNKKIIPVSPATFYAYLQTIVLGLRGMRIEERSREILDLLSQAQRSLAAFSESFRVVGQHVENSTKKYNEAAKRLEKFEISISQMNSLAKDAQNPTDTQNNKNGE